MWPTVLARWGATAHRRSVVGHRFEPSPAIGCSPGRCAACSRSPSPSRDAGSRSCCSRSTVAASVRSGGSPCLLLLPAALLAPLVAVASDAFPRHIVLTVGYALIAATSIGTGVAMLTDAPIQVVYGLAVVFSILLTFGGPTIAAIIPTAATTADELTAANTATGVVDTAGRLVGPLLAGAILAVASPGAVLVWIGALMGVGALSTAGARPGVVRLLRPPRRRSGPTLRARRIDGRAPAARPRPAGAHPDRGDRDDVVDRRSARRRSRHDRDRRAPSRRCRGERAAHRVRSGRPARAPPPVSPSSAGAGSPVHWRAA